jgi:hypothetical protein
MANIHTVFEAVIETAGRRVRVGVADKHEYETVRTRLVKLWNSHKETLISIAGADCDPLLVYSLCGNFDPQDSSGVFFLGKPRRRQAKNYSFSIVDNVPATGTEIQDAVNDELPRTDITNISKRR